MDSYILLYVFSFLYKLEIVLLSISKSIKYRFSSYLLASKINSPFLLYAELKPSNTYIFLELLCIPVLLTYIILLLCFLDVFDKFSLIILLFPIEYLLFAIVIIKSILFSV